MKLEEVLTSAMKKVNIYLLFKVKVGRVNYLYLIKSLTINNQSNLFLLKMLLISAEQWLMNKGHYFYFPSAEIIINN